MPVPPAIGDTFTVPGRRTAKILEIKAVLVHANDGTCDSWLVTAVDGSACTIHRGETADIDWVGTPLRTYE